MAKLVAMILIALAPRLIMAVFTPVITIDGVGYIEASRGGTDAAAEARLPLYPKLIKGLDAVLEDPVLAGKMISVVFGTLFPFLVWLLARKLLPWINTWAIFLLAAFQPYLIRFSGDVLTEPLFLSLMAGLFLLAVHGIKNPYCAVGAGMAAALLCLTRPEGFAVAGLSLLGLFLTRGPRGYRPVFIFTLCWLACLAPPILSGVYSGGPAGTLSKTYFENLARFEKTLVLEETSLVRFIQKEPARFFKKTFHGLGQAAGKLVEALHPAVFALSLLGLWFMRKERLKPESRGIVLLPALGLFLFFAAVYPSKRYLLQCSIPFLLWAGLGITWIERAGKKGRTWAVAALVVVCLLCQLKAGFSQRHDKLYLRESGEEIAELAGGSRPLLITSSARLAFYAGADRVEAGEEEIKEILNSRPATPVFLILEAGRDYSESLKGDPRIEVFDLARRQAAK